jgi:hypothetical protein
MKFVGLAWRNLWRNRRRSMVTISSLTFDLPPLPFLQVIPMQFMLDWVIPLSMPKGWGIWF